jgi:hypothetical protein
VINSIVNNTGGTKMILKKFHKLLYILVLGVLWQCSIFNKKEDDKTAENLLLFSLLQQNLCTLDGQSFIIKGEITCSNNEASGTGSLIATKENDVVSLKVTGTLNESDSEIKIIGAADNNLSGSGFIFRPNEAKAFRPDGTSGGVAMTSSFAPPLSLPSTFTHCVEIHADETLPHLVAWRNSCPSAPNSSPDYDSEDNDPGGSSGKKGKTWGIELKKSKVQIKINSEEIFSH